MPPFILSHGWNAHDLEKQRQSMRPENSVLCPLAFCVPITFHFHEEFFPPTTTTMANPAIQRAIATEY
jgi:hypothetical protein